LTLKALFPSSCTVFSPRKPRLVATAARRSGWFVATTVPGTNSA